jgi:predicted small lipoprotein YifL
VNRYVRAAAVAAVVAALAGCGTEKAPSSAPPSSEAAAGSPAPTKPVDSVPAEKIQQLPQGGTKLFPDYRVVAYYGTAGNAALGVLGEGSPDKVLPRLRSAARGFAGDRRLQVAYELIATVAQAKPGKDGDYSKMIDEAAIARYVEQARRNKVLVILDLQPGRGNFLPQAERMEKFLVQPHVGLALDPEWRMPPGKLPGRTIGRVAPAEVNQVSAYVSGLVEKHNLPEKLFVLHQFRSSMLPDVHKVVKRPGLAMVQHVDGFGTRSEKDATWRRLRRPQQFHMGYKLFYDEDINRYGARDVLKFKPVPELVSFQ